MKGNVNSPSRFTSVSLHHSLALIKSAGGVMPGGTAAAAAAVAAGGVWNDGDGDGDALVPFASATVLSPTATPFGDSYADRANAVECSRHIGFAPPTSQRWARSELCCIIHGYSCTVTTLFRRYMSFHAISCLHFDSPHPPVIYNMTDATRQEVTLNGAE